MTDQEVLMQQNNSISSNVISPQEEALQSLCKQLLKSKFFRGYYEERRFVDYVNGYRDIISLHRCEREFERLLLDIKSKLQLFYHHSPSVWIGITHGAYMGMTPKKHTLDTHIWVQLEEVAFGQYWFNVKSLRFRHNEIILKLKVVRAVESEPRIERINSPRIATPTITTTTTGTKSKRNSRDELNATTLPSNDTSGGTGSVRITSQPYEENMSRTTDSIQPEVMQIGYEDFMNVIHDWGINIKHSVYDFMSNDINKDNIKDLLQFLGLVVVSLLTSSVVAIKYLGTFTLRFMFEFTRFTQVMTPIIFKLLEVINKIMGGLYLLLAMIWKDIFAKRKMPQQESLPTGIDQHPIRNLKAIEYNRPLYKSIEYNIHQSRLSSAPPYRMSSRGPFAEFERKFQ